jgi:hypothetical protein
MRLFLADYEVSNIGRAPAFSDIAVEMALV